MTSRHSPRLRRLGNLFSIIRLTLRSRSKSTLFGALFRRLSATTTRGTPAGLRSHPGFYFSLNPFSGASQRGISRRAIARLETGMGGTGAAESELVVPEVVSEGVEGSGSAVVSASGSEVIVPAGPEPEPQPDPEPKIPPLTADQFRVYNRIAVQMEYFHAHFRTSWTTIYRACSTPSSNPRSPSHLPPKKIIDEGLHLVRYLTAHHNIEETFLYPILARKMPQFREAADHHHHKNKKKNKKDEECELLKQHRFIHDGMDTFEAYLRACRDKTEELDLSVLKQKMDSWGGVLLTHMDQEVEELGAENMRKYWTLAEMRAIPV